MFKEARKTSWRWLFLTVMAVGIFAKSATAATRIEKIEFLEDKDQSLTPDVVQRTHGWSVAEGSEVNQSFTSSAYWIRLTLSWPVDPDAYLVVKNPILYDVTSFTPDAKQEFITEKRGFIHRDVGLLGSRHIVFHLGEMTRPVMFLRVASISPLQVPLKIMDERELMGEARTDSAMFATIIGIIAAFAFYNLAIFISVGRSPYLYYALYGSTLAGLFLTTEGYLPSFVLPSLRPLVLHSCGCGAFISLALFTRSLLHTKALLPRIDRALFWIGSTCLLVPVGTLITSDSATWHKLAPVAACAVGGTCCLAGILSLKRQEIAKIYLAAFVAPIIGTFIYAGQMLAWLPANMLTLHGVRFGAVIEVILFSQALAMVINQLNRKVVSESRKLARVNRSLSKEVKRRRKIQIELEEHRALVVHTEKMRALGSITAAVAHEVRSPLMVLRISLERIKTTVDAWANGGNQQEATAIAIATSHRMIDRINGVVKSMLSYARDSSGEKPVQVETSSIVNDMLDISRIVMLTKGVKLTVKEVANAQILCRASDVTQILINLANNAADAIKSIPDPTIEVSCVTREVGVEFRVIDNGKGVPAEMLPKLLKTSFTTKKRGEGTGLGLGICQMLAERNGGALRYERENDRTIFSLSFATIDANQTPSAEQKSDSSAPAA